MASYPNNCSDDTQAKYLSGVRSVDMKPGSDQQQVFLISRNSNNYSSSTNIKASSVDSDSNCATVRTARLTTPERQDLEQNNSSNSSSSSHSKSKTATKDVVSGVGVSIKTQLKC